MVREIEINKVKDFLKTGEILKIQQVRSSNYVFLATLQDQNSEEIHAIYKPQTGETPLWDFPEGTLYKREVAAYELASILGWEFVPPTVVRNGPEGIGSLQLFIPHDQNSHFFEQRESTILVSQLKKICLFDALSNNADRKGGHCLLDEKQQIWGIDHGLCFHSEGKLRTVIWDWANEIIEENLLKDVQEVIIAITEKLEKTALLHELLTAEEISSLLNRASVLVNEKSYPYPDIDRPYPWPLI